MTLTSARPVVPAVSPSTASSLSLAPNWFACVMGTGIVAVAASSLPLQFPGLRGFATAVWVLAAALLTALVSVVVVHGAAHRAATRSHLDDPVMAHFYGAPPMAVLTVGAGTLLLGRDLIGLPAAVSLDWVLWFAGTAIGLLVTVVVPWRHLVHRDPRTPRVAFGGWLMPVVPPMVSASTGALLVPHAPAGPARLTLLLGCYAMFGIALCASVVVIAVICRRLAVHGVDEARSVPTLWIVLGPLGQSVTAANLLGGVASLALPAADARALRDFGLAYGLPVWGFAMLWMGLAATITVRTARAGLPFSLAWWSFTFPVGTCVTATSALALHTGSPLFRWAAVVLYAALVAAWVTVTSRTVRGQAALARSVR